MKSLKFNKISLICVFFLATMQLRADYVRFMPIEITQPDNTVISCFVTGDEFVRTVHDAEGFTIIQSEIDGYFYYAQKINDALVPSNYKVGAVNPATVGLKPWINVSAEVYKQEVMERSPEALQKMKPAKAPQMSTGKLINIVIYVRFKDEPEFAKSRADFSKRFESTNEASLSHYYEEISYNNFSIKTYQFPICDSTITLSYEDTQLRSYYQPYNAVTNTNGYQPGDPDREQAMIKRAIDAISAQVPAGLVVDADGDNYVDNVTVVIKGNADGWGKLIWPHRWSLYKTAAYILGKRVNDYIFITENKLDVKTLCHEMFHVIGAPDLYHYTDNGVDPAGGWDLMQSSGGHPTAYMKWKYANQKWISSIPEITKSGEYSLKPLTSSVNNCYKIKSPYSSNEYFVVEYRRKAGLYESNLPQSGLLISRINSMIYGNSYGPPDEVFVMRPNGSIFSNGSLATAAFGDANGRPDFNLNTNPAALLTNQTKSGINISNIRLKGDSLLFNVEIEEPVIDKSKWIVTADSYESTGAYSPNRSTDDNVKSMWHTAWTGTTTGMPHWIQIDFAKMISIKGIVCQPRTDVENGRIKDYDVMVSTDGTDWNIVASGTFLNNKLQQTVSFPESYCRYVKLVAKSEVNGNNMTSLAEFNVTVNSNLLSRTKWTLLNASSFNVGYEPALAFDSLGTTMWHSRYSSPAATYPHEIAIDMNDTCAVDGLLYLPRQDNVTYGTIARYEFYTSLDGTNWSLANSGTWAANKAAKSNFFSAKVCRYIKLVALSEISGSNNASMAEFAVYGYNTKDIQVPNTPLNFRIASRNGDLLKLTWDKDENDKSLLCYQVAVDNLTLNKTFINEIDVTVDNTKNYTFALQAIDGSGNLSDKGFLTVNAFTDVHETNINNPVIISSHNKITVMNLETNAQISLYNALGQLLMTASGSDNSCTLNHNFNGIGIVVVTLNNKEILHKRIIRMN